MFRIVRRKRFSEHPDQELGGTLPGSSWGMQLSAVIVRRDLPWGTAIFAKRSNSPYPTGGTGRFMNPTRTEAFFPAKSRVERSSGAFRIPPSHVHRLCKAHLGASWAAPAPFLGGFWWPKRKPKNDFFLVPSRTWFFPVSASKMVPKLIIFGSENGSQREVAYFWPTCRIYCKTQ